MSGAPDSYGATEVIGVTEAPVRPKPLIRP